MEIDGKTRATGNYVAYRPPGRGAKKNLWPMRIIGTFKVLSAVGFLALAILGMKQLLNPVQHEALQTALDASRLETENQFLHKMFEKVLAVPPETLKKLKVVLFFYAGLHGLEGIGLMCAQTWAEWLVVANTGLFVPWEVFEIFHSPSWLRVSALALNLAIMAYFVGRLVHQHKQHKEEKLQHNEGRAAVA